MENKKEVSLCLTIPMLFEIFFDDEDSLSDLKRNELETIIIFLNKYIKCIKHPILRLQNYVENVIPSYTDVQFKSHFRMKRTTFHHILHLIKPSLLRSKSGRKTLSPEKQFLIAIWKMATPDSYRSISEKFNVGRGSALRAVRRVSKAIAKLSPLFMTWPEGNIAEEVMMGFTVASAFPRIIGAIDGTHINIRAPHVSPECYVNRKGHHSIQLQAVCDHERRFIHCVAGHVGSVHDQRVFRLSEVHNYLKDPTKFPNDSHLVGDAAYSLHENLMTPYRDNGHLTHKQKNYNFCHSSSRMVIERTFSLLKGRFRSLLTVLDMERVDLIPEFIIACCVLHNICLLHNDTFPIDTDLVQDNDNILRNPTRGNNAGYAKRDVICYNLPMRNV